MRKIIALVVLKPQRDYNLDIINRLRDELYDKGYGLMVFGSFTDLTAKDMNDYGERSVLELIPYDRLSGLIIMYGTFQDTPKADNIIKNAKMRGIPVVCLDYDLPGIPSVNYDYKNGFGQVVSHVIEFHKCRRVYMIAGLKDNPYSDDRINVFKKICKENGISDEDSLVYYGRFWGPSAKLCIEEMFDSGVPLPDAICAANDTMAVAVIEQLALHGIRVPEDMIVSGMDGIDIGIYNKPRLTTVDTDSDRLCKDAAAKIVKLIEGNAISEPRLTRVPMKLCIHASCGCNMDTSPNISKRMIELEDGIGKVVGNETHLTKMKNKMLSVSRKDLFKALASYISDHTWVVVNSSFWDNVQGTVEDFDYEHDMNHFDEDLIAEIYKPEADGNKETRDQADYEDRCEYGIHFNRNDILPHLEEVFEKKGVVIFVPINFQNEVIGYFAFCDKDTSVNSLKGAYYSSLLCQNISTILRVVRDRETSDKLMSVLRNSYSVLQEISIHDQLTGLLNRRGLTQVLDEMCEKEGADKKVLIYSYIDIDGFKMINDMWGHDEGDEALKDVAGVINDVAGRFSNFTAGRIGGDEFVIAGAADSDISDVYLETLQDAVDRLNSRSEKKYLIELSVGKVVKDGFTAENVRESIKDADRDMYQVKKNRKQLKMKIEDEDAE